MFPVNRSIPGANPGDPCAWWVSAHDPTFGVLNLFSGNSICVEMYRYRSIYIYTYLYTYMYIYIHTHNIYIYIFVYVYIYIYIHTFHYTTLYYTALHGNTLHYTHTYIYIYIYIIIYIIYIIIYIYIYIYIYDVYKRPKQNFCSLPLPFLRHPNLMLAQETVPCVSK